MSVNIYLPQDDNLIAVFGLIVNVVLASAAIATIFITQMNAKRSIEVSNWQHLYDRRFDVYYMLKDIVGTVSLCDDAVVRNMFKNDVDHVQMLLWFLCSNDHFSDLLVVVKDGYTKDAKTAFDKAIHTAEKASDMAGVLFSDPYVDSVAVLFRCYGRILSYIRVYFMLSQPELLKIAPDGVSFDGEFGKIENDVLELVNLCGFIKECGLFDRMKSDMVLKAYKRRSDGF